MRPLAVTGAGVASAIGVGRRAFVEDMRAARERLACPVARPAAMSAPAGDEGARPLEVPGFDATKYLGDKGLRSLDRLTKLLLVATRLALDDAGLKRDGAWLGGRPERVGMVVSNAYGSLEAITELDRVATLEDARYINPARFPLTVSNSAAGYASIWEDLRALNVSVSDGNCGALDAVACANAFFEHGRADALLVGGVEALSEALALAFERLGALSRGGRLGEGAALLVLETPEAARARGAPALATLRGYGTAFTAPEREAALLFASSSSAERAIHDALADAGVAARDIDFVVSGASGLRAFDEAEKTAIRRALGDDATVLAPKILLGETLGAGGALGMLTALALLSGESGDRPSAAGPRAGAAVRGPVRGAPRTALVTSLGYYGNSSALVMSAGPR